MTNIFAQYFQTGQVPHCNHNVIGSNYKIRSMTHTAFILLTCKARPPFFFSNQTCDIETFLGNNWNIFTLCVYYPLNVITQYRLRRFCRWFLCWIFFLFHIKNFPFNPLVAKRRYTMKSLEWKICVPI